MVSASPEADGSLSRRERLRGELLEQIRDLARTQLREHGPAGISLRAIAREMGVSSPAVHYHFATLSDLVAALREDVLTEFGDVVAASQADPARVPVQDRLFALLNAYRGWALANPAEFNLIWGPPVRGCERPPQGPTEIFARRGTAIAIELSREATGSADRKALIQRCFQAWTELHGFVCLEVNGHFDWLPGTEASFEKSVRNAFSAMGLPAPRFPRSPTKTSKPGRKRPRRTPRG